MSFERPQHASPRIASPAFVAFYCTVLMILYNFAAIGLIAVPVQFILLNQLKVTPTTQSLFGFLSDTPYFIGFAFGFLRDRWRPMGKGDRGYFLAVPILMAAVYVVLGVLPHTYAILLTGIIVGTAFSALLGAAAQGLLASIAKDFGMMGRLSVVVLVTARGSMMYSSALGGYLGQHTADIVPYLASAAVCLTVPIMAFWRPFTIFRSGDEVFVSVIPEGVLAATKRLMRHKAIYLPAIVLFLWEFAPGWGTPLMRYLTEHVHLSEDAFGFSQGWLRLGTVLAGLSYAFLCERFRFKTLLNVGTLLGVLGGGAFVFIHTPMGANVICFLAGISCGIALSSYYDLLVRCCPKELEGVAFMLTYSLFTFASDISDLIGSKLYEKGGFGLANGISIATTAVIFIPIWLLPKSISNPREGERMVDPDPPTLDAESLQVEIQPV